MTSKQQNREESITLLREILKPGDTVHTILRNVSRSGMNRRISCVTSDMRDITFHVARALDEPTKNRAGYVQDAGISQSGCGMDMGFNLIYNLASVLFPDGYMCIGRDENHRCPSNDHSNGDRDYTPHMHRSGGYALNQRWV